MATEVRITQVSFSISESSPNDGAERQREYAKHLMMSGDLIAAIKVCEAILREYPDHVKTMKTLGSLHLKNGDPNAAELILSRVISIDSSDPITFSNLGIACSLQNKMADAKNALDQAIEINPQFGTSYINRGGVFNKLNRHEEAIADYDEAINIDSTSAEAFYSRGCSLVAVSRFQEALESFDKALNLNPGYHDAHLNRGTVLHELDRLDEAIASYDRAITIRPDGAEALTNKAIVSLKLGDYRTGFELYAKRFEGILSEKLSLSTNMPKWDGAQFKGNLLLWGEQGIGDEILYASCLSLIKDHEMNVVVLTDKRLHSIYKRSFPGIQVLDKNSHVEFEADTAQAAIGDLGSLLRIDPSRLSQRLYPYLTSDSAKRNCIRETVAFNNSNPVCGISWKSVSENGGVKKSVQLSDLAPLISMSDISFVNLQYGDVAEEIDAARNDLGVTIQQVDGIDVTNDIDGLLALIDACDIVFTTSNVTAHLAGAIGKKAVVMVPCGNSRLWYWGAATNSLWYPSVRLVGQKKHGDWRLPILEASGIIREELATN